jgi:hypothetical protein
MILNILTFLDPNTLPICVGHKHRLTPILFSSDTHTNTNTHGHTKSTDPIVRNVVFEDDIAEHFIPLSYLSHFSTLGK